MSTQTPMTTDALVTNIEFSRVNDKTSIPNVSKIAKSSYNGLIQRFCSLDIRRTEGLELLLKKYFGKDYFGYAFGTCKYNSNDCVDYGLTFAIPLYIFLRDKLDNGTANIKKYYVGSLPLLTKNTSFIFNGVENSIVNQMVRDCGIYVNYTHGPQVLNSVKVRTYGGKSLQFDLYYSHFIGRKLNKKLIGKRKDQGSHQSISSILEDTNILFGDMAYAFTYSLIRYKYCVKGWYISYDWRNISTDRYIYKKSIKLSQFFNIRPTYGKTFQLADFQEILGTKLRKVFIVDLLKDIKDKNYVLIDIYYKNGISIFSPKNADIFDQKLYILLLKLIGKGSLYLHNAQDLILSLTDKYDLDLVFMRESEKGSYYKLLIKSLIQIKKKKLLGYYRTLEYRHDIANIQKEDSPFRDYELDLPGRLRINTLFGLDEQSLKITSSDILSIIRFLLQLRKHFIHKSLIEEQDLYNRKFNTIGMLVYSCLEVIIQDLLRKQNLLVYKKSLNKLSINKARVLGFRKAVEFLQRFISRSSLCQYTEQGNSLSYITHGRKASLMGPGGLKNDNVSLEMRDVHISNYGRLCPIETPEGKSVGVVTTLSIFARVNLSNQIETPYVLVENGKCTNTIHYLSLPEERTKYIALATEKCAKDGSFINSDSVYTRYNYKTAMCSSLYISYIELSPKQLTSISSSLIPFLEHNDAIRTLMGANMQRQAVPLDFLENPMVGTGVEALVSRDLGSFISQKSVGTYNYNYLHSKYIINISSLDRYKKYITTHPHGVNVLSVQGYSLYQNRPTNQKTLFNQISRQPSGTSILNDGYSVLNKQLSLGNLLLVGYTSMNGHTYEDSIVISERLLRDGYLQTTHLEVYRTTEVHESDAYEVIRKIPSFSNVDQDGVIFIGSTVSKDEVIVCKEKRQLINYKKDKLIVYDKSIRYKNKKNGVVVRIEKFFERDINTDLLTTRQAPKDVLSKSIKSILLSVLCDKYLYLEYLRLLENRGGYKILKSINNNDLSAFIPRALWPLTSRIYTANRYKDSFPNLSILKTGVLIAYFKNKRRGSFNQELFTYFRDFSLDRGLSQMISNQNTGLKSVRVLNNDLLALVLKRKNSIRIQKPFNYLDDYYLLVSLFEILISYVILYQIQQYTVVSAYKLHRNLFKTLGSSKQYKKKLQKRDRILKMVKVTIATKHNIQPGDKLTGRYGNKGVISRILSTEDMPYLTTGQPLDIILSPLGVSSRMNLGQLFEAHLGVACIELGNMVQQIASTYHHLNHLYIKQFLMNLFKNSKELLALQNMSKNQTITLFKSLSYGTRLYSPVFESVTDQGIDTFIRKAGLTNLGKYTIIDGITGDKLDQDITVGYLYVMKLNHLIDHKMHGRSTGPYNVITQQASKGKSRNGGQRLGEMEVWALQAYGAAYTLQEMLTFKSDSTVARTNFLQNFIKGKFYKIDIPRTFKLLRDELRVLGMELSFLVKKYKINSY